MRNEGCTGKCPRAQHRGLRAGAINAHRLDDVIRWCGPWRPGQKLQQGRRALLPAGNWPAFDYPRGLGRDITGDGRNRTCDLTLSQDTEVTAMFNGQDSPTNRYKYPTYPSRGCR